MTWWTTYAITKELSKIITYLEEKDISVSGSLFGRDVINKISSKQKFDLIILDDETDTASAYEVLMELKKNPRFNIPVVIMIDDNKEFIYEKENNSYFSAYIDYGLCTVYYDIEYYTECGENDVCFYVDAYYWF